MTETKGCVDVVGAPSCCTSCHDDADQYGYDYCEVDIGEVIYIVCCNVANFLEAQNSMTIYYLIGPSGVRVDGVWADPKEIPEVWRDRFEIRFFTEDGEVRSEDVTEERYRYLLRQGGQGE